MTNEEIGRKPQKSAENLRNLQISICSPDVFLTYNFEW